MVHWVPPPAAVAPAAPTASAWAKQPYPHCSVLLLLLPATLGCKSFIAYIVLLAATKLIFGLLYTLYMSCGLHIAAPQ